MRPAMPLRDRVLSRLIIDPETDCLLWQGPLDSKGYGKVAGSPEGRRRGRTVKVHRLTYEWFVGAIPEGLQLDHLCRVRHCAAPAHLEPVTCRENVLRGAGYGGRLRQAS